MKTYRQRTNEIEQKVQLERQNLERRRHSRLVKLTSVAASAAAVVLIGALVLFTPYSEQHESRKPRDLSVYRDSEYYDLIVKLASLQEICDVPLGEASQPTNNFEKWFGHKGYENDAADAPLSPETPTSPPTAGKPNPDEQYQEVTDNQVEGVTEGDLFKRTDSRLFYLNVRGDAPVLSVYSIAGENSALLSEYAIGQDSETNRFEKLYEAYEMYLSQDGNTVTVVCPCYNTKTGYETAVIKIDVTDQPRETERVYLSGNYVSSRYANGQYLFVSSYYAYAYDYSDPTTFVPQTGNGKETACIPMDDILIPEDAYSNYFTVIYTLDDGLNVTDHLALLSYSSDVYVSQENLFLSIESYGTTEQNGLKLSGTMTTVTCVTYTDGLNVTGSIELPGTLNNRYSLDEHNGVLRAVTTTLYSAVSFQNGYDKTVMENYHKQSADLYCVDLKTFEIVASVERFAPLGESVRSVRFHGDTAYVCTAISFQNWIQDPVFAFDLSDLEHITYQDTGTIPGYSLSLATFTHDTLLGIGYGDDQTILKVELYRETENDVTSVAQVELSSASFSENYKAYMIDRERGLIGLGVTAYESGKPINGYIIFRFDGEKLEKAAFIPLTEYGFYDEYRAVVIDDTCYLLTPNNFVVQKIN